MSVRRSGVLLAVLVVAATASAQLFKRPQAALPFEDDYPQLVTKGENPVIRFPVMHYHLGRVGCAGYLYFSRDSIRYEVTSPPNDASHSFQHTKSEISVAGQWRMWGSPIDAAEYKFSGGEAFHFARVRKRFVESGRAGNFEFLPFQELVDSVTNFQEILDRIQVREARLHPPAPPAAPPVISMLDPVGAEAGKALDVPASRISLRGVASHASGIASVSVNNSPAHLKLLAPTTVEFTVPDFAVGAGASAVVVMANATDKAQAQMIFTLNRPDVRLLEPGPNFETEKEAIAVRGIAAGFRAVDRVEVAGKAATFHTNAAGEVEFEADAVPLTVGANIIQGFVIPRDGSRLPFKVDVQRKPPPGPPPLALSEVLEALQKGVPAARVASLVSQFGVSFALSDDAEKQLRDAGADATLLLAIAKARR